MLKKKNMKTHIRFLDFWPNGNGQKGLRLNGQKIFVDAFSVKMV